MQKYYFTENVDYKEVYLIARAQFKKIINPFDEHKFKDNFEEIFYGDEDYYKLFLKKEGQILCGNLAYIFNDYIFCDIFFWNENIFKTNTKEFRFFSERFFLNAEKMGIKNTIIPLDKTRFKYKFFKKYCEKVFLSEDIFKITNNTLNNEYKNHHLLKINHQCYFNKKLCKNIIL